MLWRRLKPAGRLWRRRIFRRREAGALWISFGDARYCMGTVEARMLKYFPQRLKPDSFRVLTAQLKLCPFEAAGFYAGRAVVARPNGGCQWPSSHRRPVTKSLREPLARERRFRWNQADTGRKDDQGDPEEI